MSRKIAFHKKIWYLLLYYLKGNKMTVTYKAGEQDKRPWGTWEVLAVGEGYIVKRIIVDPHQKLSLQSHEHRAEHWVIACGTGTVTLDDKIIEAPQDTPLVFIEVQAGDTLDENDVIRYEDIYGRA